MEVNIHKAKTHLSKLLQRVALGEEIIIARAGTPIARLVPVQPGHRSRTLGVDRGMFEVPDDFDAPMPPEILAAFAGQRSDESWRKKRRRERK